jgi:adenosylcobinamide-phosphate synthase
MRFALSRRSIAWILATGLLVVLGAGLFFQTRPPGFGGKSGMRFEAQGHRGARGVYPENTLPAFRHALQAGVTTLEMDLHLTADGVVVVHHDPNLDPDRTRDAEGDWIEPPGPTIHTLTFGELQVYDVGTARPDGRVAKRFPEQAKLDGVRIPSLRQMIDMAETASDGAIRYNLETKVTPDAPAGTPSPETLARAVLDVVERVERREFDSPKLAGAVVAIGLPLGAAVLAYGTVVLGGALAGSFFTALVSSATPPVTPAVTALLAGVVLWSTSSLRLLLDVAEIVIENSDDDIETAREALPALVGRDLEGLSPGLIRSAAVESLAENLSDGLVAPLLAFAVFAFVSLPAAAAAAACVKAVNTLDSMLGYPGPFGWGSARLDDLVMFVPARVTALALGVAAGDVDAPWRARRYADVPDSPNAGWPMGALAAALNVRLEKPGSYALNEVADHPSVDGGREALVATRRAGIVMYTLVALLGVIRWL